MIRSASLPSTERLITRSDRSDAAATAVEHLLLLVVHRLLRANAISQERIGTGDLAPVRTAGVEVEVLGAGGSR
jgi:hypothetical protein